MVLEIDIYLLNLLGRNMLNRYFGYEELGGSLKQEIIAGIVTFMTMSYILFVQPSLLQSVGMDFGSVLIATALASGFTTILMGIYANYPIGLAPGMGQNFFFVYSIILAYNIPWEIALGVVFIEGIIFILITVLKVRQLVLDCINPGLRLAIAAGIGGFITFIGLVDSGIIRKSSGGIIELGNLSAPPTVLALVGLLILLILYVRRVKGAILISILATTFIGIIVGMIEYKGIISSPPSISPTFFKLDIAGVFNITLVVPILILFFMDLFDTIGTTVGVASAGKLLKNGELPRANRVLLTDAVGTVTGSLLGTSTITSYIESASGIASGGRTGLSSVVTGILFIISIFFYPLISMIGGGVIYNDISFNPIIGPVLILVGAMMWGGIKHIDWSDPTEFIPAFLVIIGIPLTYNIAHGMAFGLISYPLLKFVSGKGNEVKPVAYILGAIFLARYIFLSA